MGCAMLDFNFEPGVIVPQQYGTGYLWKLTKNWTQSNMQGASIKKKIEYRNDRKLENRIEGLSSFYMLKGGHRGAGSRGSPIFGIKCF